MLETAGPRANRMIGLEYHYDPDVWLSVPTVFPGETGLSMDGWVAGQSGSARARGMQDSPTAGPVENYFRAVAEFAIEQGRNHDEVWMLVSRDVPGVEILLLDVVEAAVPLDDRLRNWVEQTGSESEPATVTQLHSSGLGEGYLVVRNDIDPDDRSVFATLNVVFRVKGYDVILSTQSDDLIAFNSAMPLIREFVDGIAVIDPVLES